MIAKNFDRVVIGDYGAFIEFDEKSLASDLLVKKGQEFRMKKDFPGKYHWLTTKHDDVKIYYQLKPVKYADYKVGKYYISPYEIMDQPVKNMITCLPM